jgi:hypothetical protein
MAMAGILGEQQDFTLVGARNDIGLECSSYFFRLRQICYLVAISILRNWGPQLINASIAFEIHHFAIQKCSSVSSINLIYPLVHQSVTSVVVPQATLKSTIIKRTSRVILHGCHEFSETLPHKYPNFIKPLFSAEHFLGIVHQYIQASMLFCKG